MRTIEEIALQVAKDAAMEISGASAAEMTPEAEAWSLAFARRLVAALQADGWQMVPKEPTPEMVKASWDMAGYVRVPSGRTEYISIAYQAMLSAAPVVNPDWQMVPKEPTEAMLMEVGTMDGWDGVPSMADKNHVSWYKAMLSAAPEYKP